MTHPSIWAVLPVRDGSLPESSLEVLEEARRLSGVSGADVLAVLIDYGSGPGTAAEQAARMGAAAVALVTSGNPKPQSAIARTLSERIDASMPMPMLVLFSGSARGVDLGARCAVALDLELVDKCVQVDLEGGTAARAARSVDAGRGHAIHRWSGGPVLVALLPGVVGVGDQEVEPRSIPTETWAVHDGDASEVVVSLTTGSPRDQEIQECDLLVSVGRGIGGPESLPEVFELAELLEAGVSGSRPAIEAGWLPYPKQVGQTGRAVAPRLYLALGISGATQHLAGIQRAECVVAINTDASAPLLARADLAVLGDVHEIVPALTRALAERRSASSRARSAG